LPFTLFDKNPHIAQCAIVENKRLGAVLARWCGTRGADSSAACSASWRGGLQDRRLSPPKSEGSDPRIYKSLLRSQDQVRSLLCDHDGRRVGVRRSDCRHDRSIDDAQALEATNAQFRIDDRIIVFAHSARSDRVPHGRGRSSNVLAESSLALHARTWSELFSAKRTQGLGCTDASGQSQALHEERDVAWIGEVPWIQDRGLAWIT
jgi:hypothetical protein